MVVFQRGISYALIFLITFSSYPPQAWTKEVAKPSSDSPEEAKAPIETVDIPMPTLFQKPEHARQKFLENFSNDKKKLEATSSLVEKEQQLRLLKQKAQDVLNAPPIDWSNQDFDYYMAEIEDYLASQYQKHFTSVAMDRKIFKNDAYLNSMAFNLEDRALVYLAYQQAFRDYQRALVVDQFSVARKDRIFFEPYYLTLTESGKDVFLKLPLQSPDSVLKLSSGLYRVVPQVGRELQVEQSALASLNSAAGWKSMMHLNILNQYLEKWTALDLVWVRPPGAPSFSVLPQNCDQKFFSLHPLMLANLNNHDHLVRILRHQSHQAFAFLAKKKASQLVPEIMNEETAQDLFRQIHELFYEFKMHQLNARQKAEAVAETLKQRFAEPLQPIDKLLWDTLFESLAEGFQETGVPKAKQQFIELFLTNFLYEREITLEIFAWLLSHQERTPLEWRGSEEQIKYQIKSLLLASKKFTLNAMLAQFFYKNPKLTMKESQKFALILLIDQWVEQKKDAFTEAVEAIYNVYKKIKKNAVIKSRESTHFAVVKQNADMLLEAIQPVVQELTEQDRKIHLLEEAKTLAEVFDTPFHFKVYVIWMLSLDGKDFSKEDYKTLEKILFDDTEFDAKAHSVEDGTYRAARLKYEMAKKKKALSEAVEKVATQLKWHEPPIPLGQLIQPEKRHLFEKSSRQQLILDNPILGVEVLFREKSALLYQHLEEVRHEPLGISQEVLQRAIWNLKSIVSYEVERFCSVKMSTVDGEKYLFVNEDFSMSALSKNDNQALEKIHLEVVQDLGKALERDPVEHAIGIGFLVMIGASFVMGPLSRLPRWMAGAWIPRVPKLLMNSLNVAGLAISPWAMTWIIRDYRNMFWRDPAYVEAAQHWQEARFIVQPPITLEDRLEAQKRLVEVKKLNEPVRKNLMTDPLGLKIGQGSMILFAPLFFTFFKNMFEFGNEIFLSRSYAFTRERATVRALKRLGLPAELGAIPLQALHPTALKRVYGEVVEEALSSWRVGLVYTPRVLGGELASSVAQELPKLGLGYVKTKSALHNLKRYVDTYLTILKRDLSRHEAQFGRTATSWDETVGTVSASVHRMWVPRHPEHLAYLSSRQGLIDTVVKERANLLCSVRLFERAAQILTENGTATTLAELRLGPAFAESLRDLKGMFSEALPAEFRMLVGGEEMALTWLLKSMNFLRFHSLWWGHWVGIRGPLGRALQKAEAYRYLLATQDVFLKSNGLTDVARYIYFFRVAEEALLQERLGQGLSVSALDLSEAEIQAKMVEITSSRGWLMDLKARAINLAIERRVDEGTMTGIASEARYLTDDEIQVAMNDILLRGIQPRPESEYVRYTDYEGWSASESKPTTSLPPLLPMFND
ncbi:MAG: hypothetical protein HY390_00650 [Deltaproteobacteria bacterium]|nr:hypothetical protein [Deltaproteobacteria bacterium]